MMPMQRPEAPQGSSEAQGGLQLTLLDQPGEGSPQVLMFALKSLQPLLLLWAEESVLCLFCQLHEAFVHERRDRFKHICLCIVTSAADCLHRLEGAAADEDGQAAEESLFLSTQEIVTPLDGGAQRSLALRKIACSSC